MDNTRRMHFAFSLLIVLIAVIGLLEGTPYLRQAYAWVQYFASQEKTEYKFALVLKKGELDDKDRQILAGIDDQIKQVNASNAGFLLSYNLYADGETPEEAEKIALDISSAGDNIAVIGHGGYENSKRAADYYLVTQMPFLSLTETHFNLTAFNDWSFRLIFDELRFADYIAERLKTLSHDKNLVILTDGEGASPAFLSTMSEKLPGTQIISEKKVRKAMQALTGLQSPDKGVEVLLLGRPEFVTGCLAKLAPSKTSVIVIDDLEEDARRLLKNDSNLAEVTLLSPFVPDLASVAAKNVAREYEEKRGVQPTWRYFLARAGIELLAHAVKQNAAASKPGEFDVRAIRKEVQANWAASKSVSSSVTTLTGPIYFDADGNASSQVYALDVAKGRSNLSGAQFVSGATGGTLQPLSVVWVSADLIGVEPIKGADDRRKTTFSVQLASRAPEAVLAEMMINDVKVSSLGAQIETTSANGWSFMRGQITIEAPIEQSGTESLTDGARTTLNIRHAELDRSRLVVVPVAGVDQSRLLASSNGGVSSRQLASGQDLFLLGGFARDDGSFSTQEFSQATFFFGLRSPFQSFLESAASPFRTIGLFLLLGLGVLATVWGAYAVVANRVGTIDSLLLPLCLLCGLIATKLSLFLAWYEIDELSSAYWLNKALLTGIVFSAGAVGISFTNRLFRVIERTSEKKVAGIIRTFVGIGWWVVIAGAVAFVVGELSLSQALATSGLLVFTIGLAIQPLILDAFSGLMLSIERSFMIGDWIEVTFPGSAEPVVGRVKDANWRSVGIVTRDGNEVTIPNHIITTKHLTNFSRPSPESRIDICFLVENKHDLHEIMSSVAAKSREYISGTSILAHPAPRVVVEELKDQGVELKIQAWYRADLHSPDTSRTDLTHVLSRVIREGGWHFALPTLRYIKMGDAPAREVSAERQPV